MAKKTAINDRTVRVRELERVKTMLDTTPLACRLWDRNFNMIECNEAAAALFGLKTRREYIEKYLDFSPEYQSDGVKSGDKIKNLITDAFENGACFSEWVFRQPDGGHIPSEVFLVRVPYGDDFAVAAYSRDLREQRKMAADIERRDLLLQIENQAIDILLRSDPDGFESTLQQCMGMIIRAIHGDRMYLFKNYKRGKRLYCTQIHEWTEKIPALKGTGLAMDVSYDKHIPVIKESLACGECVHVLVRDLAPPDREWLKARGALVVLLIPVFIQNEFWGFMGFDKCKREELFMENEESVVRSGSFVMVDALLRNESLMSLRETSARLETALADAKEANNAKSLFLARMSHEIRTPLNAVIGFSELILDENMSREAEEGLEKIYNAGSTILNIVNDILDISKIESGKFEIVKVNYDTPSLINDTVMLNVVRIGEKPITFSLFVDSKLPGSLCGDDIRVKQIFNNLLSNAFKYTKSGNVEWHISFERGGNGSVWLLSSVRDTGMGIKPDDIKKLFADYNQVDMKSNRKVEGTGLGLAITKRLVEMMDGTIEVESEYGKGTVFRVRFRQEVVSDKPIGEEVAENLMGLRYTLTRRSGKARHPRINLSYAHVLVVDDVQTNLDVVKGILKPYKVKVDTAMSGARAIEMIRQENPRYDAVFMDHMMPEMDGIEAARIIREEIGTDYAKNIPIIALTANAIVGNEKMFLKNNFQGFVSKPIDLSKLDGVLKTWVRNKEREKELDVSEGAAPEEEKSGSPDGLPPVNLRVNGINKDKAMESFDGDEGILVDVLRSYAASSRPLLANLQSYLASGNLADYAVIIHGIKGASLGIFAEETGEAARSLELAAKAGDLAAVRAGHHAFIKQAETLLANIDKALEPLGGS